MKQRYLGTGFAALIIYVLVQHLISNRLQQFDQSSQAKFDEKNKALVSKIEHLQDELEALKKGMAQSTSSQEVHKFNPIYVGFIGHGKEVRSEKNTECFNVTGDAYCADSKLGKEVACKVGNKVEIVAARTKNSHGHDKFSYGCVRKSSN